MALRTASTQDGLRREFLRQSDILDTEAAVRLIAAGLVYLISAVFLSTGLIAVFATMNLALEYAVYWLHRDVDALILRRARYAAMLGCVFGLEVCFVMPAALMWHVDDPYTKAFAVGITASTMMHVATVRAIHLPMGLSAAAAIWIVVLTSNGLYWTWAGDWMPLLATTICALAALTYFLSATIANNRLHRETASGWAEAMEANAVKTRFLAQVSHELRTPLNAILGMGHAELARARDATGRDRMQLVVDAAQGLTVLLDDILDMAALQEGRLPIRPVPLDPVAALTTTVALFRPQAVAAGLVLDLMLDDNLPRAARLDGQRLRQCLSNILSNALKHTDTGVIQVTARMRGDDRLCIEVTDSGRGVPPEVQSLIFEPFQRGPGQHGGTGLGLAISRTLARRMGGDLVLLPSPQGARFELTLVLSPAMADEVALPSGQGTLDLTGLQVLVVDDIATNRLVAATYLRSLGARVTEADGGVAAVAMAALSVPAAILLDMNMPGMNGIETLQRLRALGGRLLDVPVVAMTADATEAHRRHYLSMGLDGYVAKPISPDRLIEVLRPHLGAVLAGSPDAAQGGLSG